MRDVRLVGVTDDGTRLVLAVPGGERFSLLVDHRVRSAISGDYHGNQLALDGESRLRPRDIQSRIRSGQSPEQVAVDAGVPVEHVLRFAGPILHEREHMAQQAAAAGVARDEHGAVLLLGELVGERLEERGVPRSVLAWDAWRRDDGRWEVRLEYSAGETTRSALWVYDPTRRTVTADDDEARWLLSEEPTATVTPLRPGESSGPRPVPMVSGTDIPDDVAEVIGLIDSSASAPGGEQPGPVAPEGPDPTEEPARPSRKSARAAKKRATVPSWDEILFGSKKPE